ADIENGEDIFTANAS
nr:RecName: Full=Cytochrome c6; AltName: Full=Cytochrome c-553; AltName: Full=Cytochrome c553; AltName: Full=Soluble cytochrome f [Chattonella marina var. antiqua]